MDRFEDIFESTLPNSVMSPGTEQYEFLKEGYSENGLMDKFEERIKSYICGF